MSIGVQAPPVAAHVRIDRARGRHHRRTRRPDKPQSGLRFSPRPTACPHQLSDGRSTVAAPERELDPLDAGVVSVTRFQAGSTFNVIPPVAHLGGTWRALDEGVRRLIERRIGEVAASVAGGLGCAAVTRCHDGYPITRNEPRAVAAFDRIAGGALGADRLRPVERPVMGGEDFAFYLEKVPGCMFVLGLLPPGQESMPALHHPAFDFNDEAIAVGVDLFCRLALDPAA